MDILNEIKILDLSQKYQREIFGLGEVYEIMSVEKLRKKLLAKFNYGKLYLATNLKHNKQRGITEEDLENFLKNSSIIAKGYVDSPCWFSTPLSQNNKKNYPSIMTCLAKIIFMILVRIESLWEGPTRSHMIYCFVK